MGFIPHTSHTTSTTWVYMITQHADSTYPMMVNIIYQRIFRIISFYLYFST
jgi:hypothetical protein